MTEPKKRKAYLRPTGPEKKGQGKMVFLLILGGLILFFFSPLPTLIIQYLPESKIEGLFSGLFENITLDDSGAPIDTPRKYEADRMLPVLGRDTGLCFFFDETAVKDRMREKLNRATRDKPIAEVIAMSPMREEYPLSYVDLHTGIDGTISALILCHKFEPTQTLMPKAIRAVYARPISTITPYKVTWTTTKTIQQLHIAR